MAPSSIEKEIKKLEGELKVKPDSIVFARLADNYRKKGNIEKAIELCTKGILKYPFYTTAKIILGKCYLEQERYAEALQMFKEVCKEDPRNMVAIKVAADIFLRQGMRDKAGALYLLLTKMDPANSALSSIAAKYPVGGASNDLFSILELYKEDVFSSQPSPYPAEEDNVIEIESGEGTPVSGEDVTNRIATLFGEKVEDSTMENEVSVSQIENGFSEESTPVSGTDISERIDQLFSTTTSSKVNKEEVSFPQSIVSDLKDAVTKENIQVKENIPWESSIEEQTIEIKEALAPEEEKIIDNIPDLSIEESREEISGVDISQRLDEIFSSEGQNKLEQQKLNTDLSQENTLGQSEEKEFYSSEKRSDEVTTLNVEEPLVAGEKFESIELSEDFPEGEVAFGITKEETPDFTYEEKEAEIVTKESFEIGSINNEVFEQDVVSGEDIKEKIEELFTDNKHETTKTETLEQQVTYPEKDEMVFEEEQSATIKTETLEDSIKEGEEIPLVSEQGEEPVFEDDFIPPEFEETLQFDGELFEQMLNPSDDAVFVEDLVEDKMVNAVTEEMDLSLKPQDEIDSSITLLDLDSEEKDIESLPEMSFSFDDVISEKNGEEKENFLEIPQDMPQQVGISSLPSSSDIVDKEYDAFEIEREEGELIENISNKISDERDAITEEDSFIRNDKPYSELFNIEELLTKDNGAPEKEEVNYEEDIQEQPMVISGSDIKERLDTFFPDSNTNKEKISSTDNVKKEESSEIWEQVVESSAIENKEIVRETEGVKDKIEEEEEEEKSTLEGEKTFALTSEQLEEVIKNSTEKEETETTLPEVELYEEKYESEMSEWEEDEESEIDSRDRAFEIPDHVLTPTLADIYFQQGQYELALKIYKRLLERNLDKEKIEARIEEIEAAIAQQQNTPELLGKEKKIEISKNKLKHSPSKSIKKESEDNRPLAGVRINKRILNAKKISRRKKRENN